MKTVRVFAMVMAQVLLGTIAVWAQTQIATIPVSDPRAVGHNVVTNKIYVVSGMANDLVEIDGTTFQATTIPLQDPIAGVDIVQIAVNPVTNMIYVTALLRAQVMVINGATHAVTSVPTQNQPYALAVNVVTNKIYVANWGSNSVTIIDGAQLTATNVAVGELPVAIAVNPITNKIYVANTNNGVVSVIDGVTNAVTNIAVGAYPSAIAIDLAANDIYVTNQLDHTLSLINGRNNHERRIQLHGLQYPWLVAANSLTGLVYVAFQIPGQVMVIDKGKRSIVPVDFFPLEIALDTRRERLYAAAIDPEVGGSLLGTLDGATLTGASMPSGGNVALRVAVDELRNRIFVMNLLGDLTVFAGEPGGLTDAALQTGIVP